MFTILQLQLERVKMNNLFELLKSDLKQAILKQDSTKKNILRVVLAECGRLGLGLSNSNVHDADIQKIIMKSIQNNLEVMSISPSEELEKENEILKSYVPKIPTQQEYKDLLNTEEVRNLILAEFSEGLAMKQVASYLKSKDIPMDGKIVKSIIAEIRNQ